MAALPVDAPAARADPEPLVRCRDRARQTVHDVRLLDRGKRKVAMKAERERSRARAELESLDDLPELRVWLSCVDVAGVRDGAAHQQRTIAGENDPPLLARPAANLLVRAGVLVAGVEPGHAQQPRQGAEMRVGDEARHA